MRKDRVLSLSSWFAPPVHKSLDPPLNTTYCLFSCRYCSKNSRLLKVSIPCEKPRIGHFAERVWRPICLWSTGAIVVWCPSSHHQWPWWNSNQRPIDHEPQALSTEPCWLPILVQVFENWYGMGNKVFKTFLGVASHLCLILIHPWIHLLHFTLYLIFQHSYDSLFSRWVMVQFVQMHCTQQWE